LAAADEMDIDCSQSWVIGNSSRDVEAGLRAGCKTILLDNPSHDKKLKPGEPSPDHKAVNIKEAVNIIKKYHRSLHESDAQAQPIPAPNTKPDLHTIEQSPQQRPVQPKAVPLVTKHRCREYQTITQQYFGTTQKDATGRYVW